MDTMGKHHSQTWYQQELQLARKSNTQVEKHLYLTTTINKKCTDRKMSKGKEMKRHQLKSTIPQAGEVISAMDLKNSLDNSNHTCSRRT